jgi:glycolate oxidase FAD binding subunit
MLKQLNTWMGEPLPLNASSWVDGRANGAAVGGDGQDTLYLRLRGARAAVESACAMLQRQHGAQRVDSPGTQADWARARDLQLPFFTPPSPDHALWRLSLPPTAPALDLPQPQLIEWMGGLRWLWAQRADSNLIQNSVKKAGGFASIFIAACGQPWPIELSNDLEIASNVQHQKISERLKAQFDPAGIFNPGEPLGAA